MSKVYYFGYGANRISERIREVVGQHVKDGQSAIVENCVLGIQGLSCIPETPKKILGSIWGANFRSYSIKTGVGIVAGVLWEINSDDLDKIRQWEMVPEWKEIISITVKTSKGVSMIALTDKVADDSRFDEFVDGLNYISDLNPTNIRLSKQQEILDKKKEEERIAQVRKTLEVLRNSKILE